ncbi:small multi-drug export protein [Geomicrobium sp. JCM 19039]|uniref:small multi-drug export protein n=1 Tax=Geomicrobium sp. JCM 19039 TaxID=1460636 RepID=UPI0005A62565|nr:small multi-drug export protein [Geomicrobium sp. JCM 19039]
MAVVIDDYMNFILDTMQRVFISVQDFVIQLSEVNGWLVPFAVVAIGFIPFLEAFFAGGVASFTGVPVVVAAIGAIIGNVISVLLIILPFDALFERMRNRKTKKKGGFIRSRFEKAGKMYRQYGVAGLAILTPLYASGHIAAFASLAAGAKKQTVIFWHVVSIVLWGVLGALFGAFVGFDHIVDP